ncbi:MAG: hypothetical protein AAF581_19510 [Planctomycetota bacterium]
MRIWLVLALVVAISSTAQGDEEVAVLQYGPMTAPIGTNPRALLRYPSTGALSVMGHTDILDEPCAYPGDPGWDVLVAMMTNGVDDQIEYGTPDYSFLMLESAALIGGSGNGIPDLFLIEISKICVDVDTFGNDGIGVLSYVDLAYRIYRPSRFLRGDANVDGSINIADAIAILTSAFTPFPPPCADALDSNDDNAVNIADAVYLLAHLFNQGPAPMSPWGVCDKDPTPTGAPGCEDYGVCP